MTRFLRFFRPSHQHTAFSATLLLMGTVMASRVIGYAREAYIAYAFGAGSRPMPTSLPSPFRIS